MRRLGTIDAFVFGLGHERNDFSPLSSRKMMSTKTWHGH
jgi:hypothetical protein